MDLKLEEVSELLNLTPQVVDDLVKQGSLPGYKLNAEYRFSREEIEQWMVGNSHHIMFDETVQMHANGLHQYSLYRAINRGGVFDDIEGENKEEIFSGLTARISNQLNLDAEVITELLLDREALMPTSLGRGFAVPHSRDFLLQEPVNMVAVVFPKKPIEYGALDGIPVHTLFFLFSSTDKMHLHLLAKIAHLTSDPSVQDLFIARPKKSDVLGFVRSWEPQLKTRST